MYSITFPGFVGSGYAIDKGRLLRDRVDFREIVVFSSLTLSVGLGRVRSRDLSGKNSFSYSWKLVASSSIPFPWLTSFDRRNI